MNNCKRLMIFVWIFSLSLATPAIFGKNIKKTTITNYEETIHTYSCKEYNDWRGFAVAIYKFVTLFVLPSILMIACYTWVIIELWLSTKTMSELTNQMTQHAERSESRTSISKDACSSPISHKVILRSHAHNEQRDVKAARQQVIKMLILVVLLFLVCWGPRLLIELLIKCCINVFGKTIYVIRIVFYLLPFVHSCLNPIVYCFMSTKFRRKILATLSHCMRRDGHHEIFKMSCSKNGQPSSVYTMNSVSETAITRCPNSVAFKDI